MSFKRIVKKENPFNVYIFKYSFEIMSMAERITTIEINITYLYSI